MPDGHEETDNRTIIGGRHGSPYVTVAFPFSKVTTVDSERAEESIRDLAALVAALASCVGDLAGTVQGSDRAEAVIEEAGRVAQAAALLAGDPGGDVD